MIKNKRRLVISLIVLFALNIIIFLLAQRFLSADAAVYRQGSTGETVRQIQTKLKNWGYYKGNADGIYGPKTVEAVKYFQRKNGLVQDGIAGPKTLEKIGISSAASTASGNTTNRDNDRELLARIISAEARGEPYNGQVAVGAVVLNRIRHPSFPNTLAGVIYQQGAFTAITDGQFNKPIAESSRKAAVDAMNGWDPTGGCIYYFNPSTATSAWIWSRPIVIKIGRHNFCK